MLSEPISARCPNNFVLLLSSNLNMGGAQSQHKVTKQDEAILEYVFLYHMSRHVYADNQ